AGREPAHAEWAGRHGRPHPHVHGWPQPEPARRHGDRQGSHTRRSPRRDDDGRRGRRDHARDTGARAAHPCRDAHRDGCLRGAVREPAARRCCRNADAARTQAGALAMTDADVLFPWEKDGREDAQDYAPEADAAEERAAGDVDAGAAQVDGIGEADTAAQAAGEASHVDEGAAHEPVASSDADAAGAAEDAVSDDAAAVTSPAGSSTDAAASEAAAEASPEGAAVDAAEVPEDESRFEVLDTEYARRAAERASAALRENPIAQKEYYSISEVCELVGLKPHVLRYWETQFQVLNPSKNRSGNRVYQRKEIRLITLVKHLLYEEKYTVEGAKAKLDQLRRTGELTDTAGAVLDRAMIEQLRADLSELTTLLTPPART